MHRFEVGAFGGDRVEEGRGIAWWFEKQTTGAEESFIGEIDRA